MKYTPLLLTLPFILSACGSAKTTPTSNSNPEALPTIAEVTYADKFATVEQNFTKTIDYNSDISVEYKTYDPSGSGKAYLKAKSLKPIDRIGDVTADEGKKLYVLELSVMGNAKNKGLPSTFNQIGDYPSPQFVIVDRANTTNFVEETYFSDIYTRSKKYFELSKLTLDQEQWNHTAIVFQIDQGLVADLALRFTNLDGKIEFYDVRESQ